MNILDNFLLHLKKSGIQVNVVQFNWECDYVSYLVFVVI